MIIWDLENLIMGDSIYNGAFDNATGVRSLINIAKAFTSLKENSKRSIIFISTAPEEEGLLGSKYFVQNPVDPVNKMVVEINMDAVNIWGISNSIALIGCKYSNLFDYVNNIAKSMNMYVIDDSNPNVGSFCGSDQLHFANAGVPCVYF
jgi:Zn-dependent M28 family amino/carboxypeptidase